MKECSVKKEEGNLVAKITCELDHHAAKIIRESIDKELSRENFKALILDFSEVKFMDSSGIGLILGRAAKAEDMGAVVEVTGLFGNLKRLVRMSGMERIANIKIK